MRVTLSGPSWSPPAPDGPNVEQAVASMDSPGKNAAAHDDSGGWWRQRDPPSIGRSMGRERTVQVRSRSRPRPTDRTGRVEGVFLRPRAPSNPRVPHLRRCHLQPSPRPEMRGRELRLTRKPPHLGSLAR